jgi:hypothetical protein
MIYLLLLISSTLLLILILWKRDLGRTLTGPEHKWVMYIDHPEKKKSIKYLLLTGAREFLVPFTITALIFSLLQLWIDIRLQSVDATTTIRELETHIRWIRKYLAPLKLDDWQQLLILIFIVALGYFLPKIKEFGVLKRYKQTTRFITRLYIVLTMLASFTFFSNQADKTFNAHIVRLSAQINQTESEYNAYRSELELLIRKLVVQKLIEGSQDIVEKLTGITNELIVINNEIRDAEKRVDDYPFIPLHAFELDIEKFKKDFKGDAGDKDNNGKKQGPDNGGPPGPHNPPSPGPGSPPPTEPNNQPPAPIPVPSQQQDKSDWNLEAGRKLASEAREINQRMGASDSQPLAEIVEKSVDTVHSDVIKELFLQLITNKGGGLWNLVDVGLEPDVIYNCNNKIGQLVQRVFDATSRGHQRLNEALASQQGPMGENDDSCLKDKRGYLTRLKSALTDLLRKRNEVERIKRGTQDEITRKGEAQYDQQIRRFREEWNETYDFGVVDTTNASRSLREAIEENLVRIQNPLERSSTLESYKNRLNFSSNRSVKPIDKYTFLATFEIDNLGEPVFQPRAKRWFKEENAGVGLVRKYCAECGVNVPSYSRPGMICPFCHVLWGREETTVRRKAKAFEEAERMPAPVIIR